MMKPVGDTACVMVAPSDKAGSRSTACTASSFREGGILEGWHNYDIVCRAYEF